MLIHMLNLSFTFFALIIEKARPILLSGLGLSAKELDGI
jgi:hypothetical protein